MRLVRPGDAEASLNKSPLQETKPGAKRSIDSEEGEGAEESEVRMFRSDPLHSGDPSSAAYFDSLLCSDSNFERCIQTRAGRERESVQASPYKPLSGSAERFSVLLEALALEDLTAVPEKIDVL